MYYLHKATLIALVSLFVTTPTAYAQLGEGVSNMYTEEEEEVRQSMEDIIQSVKDGDVDQLISFHAYGPKFTEFKQGAPRNGSHENEEFERGVFGNVQDVIRMNTNDLKVAVYYGTVANVTFHSDFQLKFEEDVVTVKDQITLLFVKTDRGDWKIVHEHHSPLAQG